MPSRGEGGKIQRRTQYFIVMSHKHGPKKTSPQRSWESNHLRVTMESCCSLAFWGLQGQQALVKGWAQRSKSELERFHRNNSPRGLQTCEQTTAGGCQWVRDFSTRNPPSVIGLSSQPQPAAAIRTARAWGVVWGAVGTWPHPDHSLKLWSFKTVPQAKEVPFRLHIEIPQQQGCQHWRHGSEAKWPLTRNRGENNNNEEKP